MEKRIISSILLMAVCIGACARGRIVTDSLRSDILGTNVRYNVYLPEGFGEGGRSYPVVYLLHGLYDDFRAWSDKAGIIEIADDLISGGEAAEMVIVMPNAGGFDVHRIWNGYFNMPGWRYEDFFFKEMMPQVEKKYSCISDKYHRAIMGLSMGGGGSVVYCQHHPELFSSCYAMSAWLDENVDDLSADKDDKFPHLQKAVHANSPSLFLDNADDAAKDALRSVRWCLDCGDDDDLLPLSFELHMKMKSLGIKSELRVRNGIHNWEYWHISVRSAIPFASAGFRMGKVER